MADRTNDSLRWAWHDANSQWRQVLAAPADWTSRLTGMS